MIESTPHVVVIGGPNGAGKSTIAQRVLKDALSITTFVNADVIAKGLCAYDPDSVAMQAGVVMLERLHDLAGKRANFAFETTMSGRTSATWLRGLRQSGYEVSVIFSWLRSADLAVARVARRVRDGGHSIPEDVIRRRYSLAVSNLVKLYIPLATRWQVYDNSGTSPVLIAGQTAAGARRVAQPATWRMILDHAEGQTDNR